MTRTIVAVFNNFDHAQRAVRDLVDAGFSRTDISMVASDATGRYRGYLEGKPLDEDVSAEEGAVAGAGVGAGIGALTGLLAGLGALAIPGIGPVIAAGPLAAALGGGAIGAAVGAVTGGIAGALVDMGVDETYAGYYAESIRRGGTMVVVKSSDNMVERATSILRSHHPVDIDRTTQQWRTQGWRGWDPDAEPYDYSRRRVEDDFFVPEDVNSTYVRTY